MTDDDQVVSIEVRVTRRQLREMGARDPSELGSVLMTQGIMLAPQVWIDRFMQDARAATEELAARKAGKKLR